jgi:hypothetical protein
MPDLKLFGRNFGDPIKNAKETAAQVGDYSGSTLFKGRGGPVEFDTDKYKISQHSYPSDLMGPVGEYGGNYVIFYINVAVDSKLLKDPSTQIVEDNTPRDNGDLTALSNKYNTGVAGAIAAPAGVALGGLLLGGGATTTTTLNGYTSTGISKAAYATAGVAAVGAGALKTVASTFSGAKKRLATAIALHTPNNMSTTYSVNYDEEDMDVYAIGLAAAGGTAALAEAGKQKGGSNVAGDGAINSVTAAVLSQGLKLPGTGGISKITGIAPNPRKEQVFKHVNFRNFTFDYQFYPRDVKEAENVLNIIYQFKYHMHPEFKDANNFLYIYPSEFDIFYYNNGQENMNVNRHTSCVLTDMVVNYSPNGQFTAFANGMPTQINVTLTFKELATLTKEKIQDNL